jgi:hypothetical protein
VNDKIQKIACGPLTSKRTGLDVDLDLDASAALRLLDLRLRYQGAPEKVFVSGLAHVQVAC